MDEQTFANLKASILKRKRERDEISNELVKDRQDLRIVDDKIRNLRIELDYRINILKEKEENLNDYDLTISESERTLSRLIETSNKLATALESESNYLKGKLKK